MAHEADGGLAVVILLRGLDDGVRHAVKVLVAGQQRRADGDGLEGIGIGGKLVCQVVVLKAVHQMGRLHHQALDAVGHGAVQRLAHVVDHLAVTGLDVVDDDLAGKAAAHAPVREGLLQRTLDGADGLAAAVVEAGAEADHQQLVLADFVGVARIVQRGVAGVVVLFIVLRGGLFLLGAGGQQGRQHRQCQQAGKQFFHGFQSPFK